MIDLSNFKTFDFSEGVPYISITSNGITFNKSVEIARDARPELKDDNYEDEISGICKIVN